MSKIVLKISGEALKNDSENVSREKLHIVLNAIKLLKTNGHEVGVVIGGGNFFRGREHEDMNKVTADTIGMLGTVMNALYLKDYLENNGIKAIVQTPFTFPGLIDNHSNDELKEMYKDNIIIFGGGIGKSGYSTDSGVVHAANILESDLIIKMTNVDGVYDSDPKTNPEAKKYDKISFQDVIKQDLKVMDMYAIKKCMENNIRILVIDFDDYEKIIDYFNGQVIGTIIGE